jgi:hypothetical protein
MLNDKEWQRFLFQNILFEIGFNSY